MTILLTGGTGKTSSRIAHLLNKQDVPVILASRSGTAPTGFTGCRFDWLDETTYGNPFEIEANITALYMVAPVAFDLLAVMKPFTEYAINKGVKRFVLLTSSTTPKGGHAHGKVHEYLAERGVDYGVLRPTWFMGKYTGKSPY
jgi:festuclavine dehydrogenase